jgi:transposase
MEWLSQLELSRESGTDSLKILVEQVKFLRKDLLEVNRKVRKLSQKECYRERINLLMSIRGIGLTTAMIILTEIEDIYRFDNQEKLASYVGRTPTSPSSGNKDIQYLKSALIESAWIAVRVDPVLHMDFTGYSKRMKKNKAIIRIARKLLNRISFVLKNEVLYKDGIK